MTITDALRPGSVLAALAITTAMAAAPVTAAPHAGTADGTEWAIAMAPARVSTPADLGVTSVPAAARPARACLGSPS